MTSFPSSYALSSTEKNSTPVLPARSILFLSDVHLGAWPDEKNRDMENHLILLIDYCEQHELEIVILGDFFDFWMEYPGNTVPPLGQKVLRRFHDFHKQTNSHTLYVTGNHDNWTNGYLRNLGFDLEHEYRIVEESTVSMMVLHGDGLKDPEMQLPRPAMHRFLRNSYFIRMYQKILPPRFGWMGMQLFSRSSRKSGKRNRNSDRRAILDTWARNRVMSDDRVQAIVYGHHHKPVLWKQNGLTCMNCGCFGTDYSLGLYANSTFELVTWDVDSKTLVTHGINADT